MTSVSLRKRIALLVARLTKKQKQIIGSLGALLVIVAIYIAAGHLHRPRMTAAEVIQVANAAAELKGFRLDEYRNLDAKFEFAARNRTWMVIYGLKLPVPRESLPKPQSAYGAPDNFFVLVDDRTKHAQVGLFRKIGEDQPVKPPGSRIVQLYTNQRWSDPTNK